MSEGLSYRDAGVDLDAAERAKERLKKLVASTRDRFTLSELGHFGGLYSVPDTVADQVLCRARTESAPSSRSPSPPGTTTRSGSVS